MPVSLDLRFSFEIKINYRKGDENMSVPRKRIGSYQCKSGLDKGEPPVRHRISRTVECGEPCEAGRREVSGYNASEGIEPRNNHRVGGRHCSYRGRQNSLHR